MKFSIAFVLPLIILAACLDPLRTGFSDLEEAQLYSAKSIRTDSARPETLQVMTWNVKFGGGRIDFFFDCYGSRVLMTQDEVTAHLDCLAAKIRQVDPDILLLQEVDIQAKRSAYVNQVQWLLDHTSLNYGAYASQWKADFIPSDGLGRMNSGNAILSKWPISKAERIALPLMPSQDALTRYFYLHRNFLRTVVDLPGEPDPYVLCIHTEAYSNDGTKQGQIEIFESELHRLDTLGELFLAGGDLNTIPPGSQQVRDFPDSKCTDSMFQADDFSEEGDFLSEYYARYESAIPLSVYQTDNSKYFSHTTDKDGFWNRTLDYLFTNRTFVPGSGLVHQNELSGGMETMPLSDHAPVTAKWILP